jgi:hypothetical protein
MFWNKQNRKHIQEVETQLVNASQIYKRVFNGEDGEWVLNDLAKRSFDKVTTYDFDEKKMALNEGRRSLFNYIKTMVEKEVGEVIEELTKEI